MMNFGYMPFGWIGMVAMVLWWVFVILVIIAVLRCVFRCGNRGKCCGSKYSDSGESPLEILQRRYAAGEVTKKEFEEKRKDLE